MSLKKRSALEQEVSYLHAQLSTAFLTSSVKAELKLDSLREVLAAANAKIGKLRAGVQTSRDQQAIVKLASSFPVRCMKG